MTTRGWKLFELEQRIAILAGEAERDYASARRHLFDALELPPLSFDRLSAEAAAAFKQKSAAITFGHVLRLRRQHSELSQKGRAI